MTRYFAPIVACLAVAGLWTPVMAEPVEPGVAPVEQVHDPADVPADAPQPAEQAPAVKRVPYLGLVLVPTTPEARAQLKLADGVGLTVADVAPNSPAEEAGLQRHDVVHKLDDQIVVNQQQMGTLVRMHGVGADVTLTVYRAGDSVAVPLKIGSTQRRDLVRPVQHQIRFAPGGVQVVPLDPAGGGLPITDEDIEERARQIEAQMERIREEMRRHQGLNDDARQRIEELLEQVQPEAPAAQQGQVRLDGPGVARAMRIADGEHVIQIREANGDKTLKVADTEGNIIFDGPINTEEQRAAVPADVLEKVEKLEKRANVRIQINRQAVPAPEPAQPDPDADHQLN